MEGYGKNSKSHKMSINISKSGELKKAAEYFKDVVNIQEVAERFITELVMNGADYAKKTCPRDQGNLENSIYYRVRPTKWGATGWVICANGHAAYVEFGTGVVGEAFAYPGDMGDYKRNVPSKFKDLTGGWHYEKPKGVWHYTHGCPPNPFMYHTAKYMEDSAPELARKIMSGR